MIDAIADYIPDKVEGRAYLIKTQESGTVLVQKRFDPITGEPILQETILDIPTLEAKLAEMQAVLDDVINLE